MNSNHEKAKILVVDDSSLNLQLLVKILAEQGYAAYPASEGKLALDFIENTLPDLILLDVLMPAMDGYQVLECLKSKNRTSQIPVIFMTALTDMQDKVKGLKLGAVDYISKPFQTAEVLARIETHLSLQRLKNNLEEQVQERTAELAEINIKLTAEIAERKQAEVERKKMEDKLRQAMKMEAIGRLAGGVAHDFNNMLSAIMGHADIAIETLHTSDPVYADLKEIIKACERSAGLTRQLLAFARQQPIMPKVIDLNGTIDDMLKMLRRLVGENITIRWKPGMNLWPVKIDSGQLDQLVLNMAINARDAIENVGELIIETTNVELDDEYCERQPDIVPGRYIILSISDNGCGIEKDVLPQIFEPFFTTKKIGKGTGLGLATVYGIIKQNAGTITVYSEVGKGTTFRIYLPAFQGDEKSVAIHKSAESLPVKRGAETILLVEDDVELLGLTKRRLEAMGYKVLPAKNPIEAVYLFKENSQEIALLLTDVVMPEMSGRDLWNKLLTLQPKLKCLFMSGYTSNVITHRGVLEDGLHFLQKPFSRADLSHKIREAIESD